MFKLEKKEGIIEVIVWLIVQCFVISVLYCIFERY